MTHVNSHRSTFLCQRCGALRSPGGVGQGGDGQAPSREERSRGHTSRETLMRRSNTAALTMQETPIG
jgi:hypothetical protein